MFIRRQKSRKRVERQRAPEADYISYLTEIVLTTSSSSLPNKWFILIADSFIMLMISRHNYRNKKRIVPLQFTKETFLAPLHDWLRRKCCSLVALHQINEKYKSNSWLEWKITTVVIKILIIPVGLYNVHPSTKLVQTHFAVPSIFHLFIPSCHIWKNLSGQRQHPIHYKL